MGRFTIRMEQKRLLQGFYMVSTGLITRKVYTKKPPLKVEYALTPFGESLAPVLTSIAEWGMTVANEKGEFIEE